MKKAILATKVGMTQIFNEDGVLTPVTVLEAGPCCNSGWFWREERKSSYKGCFRKESYQKPTWCW